MSKPAGFLNFEEALQIIRDRLGASRGWAQAILKEALESDRVEHHYDDGRAVYLLPEDGLIDFDRLPPPDPFSNALCFNQEDFLYWLNRRYPPQPAKGEAGRKPGDWYDDAKLKYLERAEMYGDPRKSENADAKVGWGSFALIAKALLDFLSKRHRNLPDEKTMSRYVSKWTRERFDDVGRN